MQHWIRQSNTGARRTRGAFWHDRPRAAARFHARLRRMARAAAGVTAALLTALAAPPDARAAGATGPVGATLSARSANGDRPLPQLDAHYSITVSGPIARVALRQRFVNDGGDWIEAVYRFPLPDSAAVDRLTVEAGGRRIVGEIRPREQAAADYEAARDSGRRAALVSQQRANLFTTALANVAPGETVTVEIAYQQRVERQSDRYTLRVPTAVTSRYAPAPTDVGRPAAADATTASVPAAGLSDRSHRLAIDVDLDAGVPLAAITSHHHRIDVAALGRTRHRVTVAGGARLDGDFVLEWRTAPAAAPRAAVFAHADGDQHYAFVQLVPPLSGDAGPPPARELVVVLDTSGSMHGAALAEAIAAVEFAIAGLGPADRFNLIAFDTTTVRLFDAPRPATGAARAEALAWLRRQRADGGTEMRPALMAALRGAEARDALRQVIFVTDGAVANEDALYRDIAAWVGPSRLFTVGIGAAPNAWFMRKAAEAGRGSSVLVGNTGGVREAMTALFARMAQPVLTDIEFDWDGAAVEAYPSHIADLYAGEPVEIAVRFAGPPPARLALRGTRWRGGVAAPWRDDVALRPAGDGSRPGVAVRWARTKLEALDDARRAGLPDAVARAAMLEVALAHHVVSEVTSLVAVDATPARGEGALPRVDVPGLLPRGATSLASLTATATAAPAQRLVGAATMLLALLVALWLRRPGGRLRPAWSR